MTTTQLTETKKKPDNLATLKNMFEKSGQQFADVAPKHLSPEKLMRLVLHAVSRSPRLLECSPMSILSCAMDAAKSGLELCGPLNEAHLVPFKNKTTKQYEAVLILGYTGLVKLAKNSGQVLDIYAHVVKEADDFDVVLGSSPEIKHTPAYLNKDRGEVVAAYACAILVGGIKHIEMMDRQEIDAIMMRSLSQSGGAWETDGPEMARKTLIRRICKYLPKSAEVESIASREDNLLSENKPRYILGAGVDAMPRLLESNTTVVPDPGFDDGAYSELIALAPSKQDLEAACKAVGIDVKDLAHGHAKARDVVNYLLTSTDGY
jgi:recombination protein RecT